MKGNEKDISPKNYNWLKYLISSVIGAAIVIIVIFAKNIVAETDVRAIMQILSDAFFVSGVILAGVGLILVCSNGGLFHIFGYAFQVFFATLKRDPTRRKHKDFYEYNKAKKDEKHSVAYLLIVGLIFVALAAVFLIAYYNV